MIRNIKILLILFCLSFAAILGNNYGRNKAENICKQQLLEINNEQIKIKNATEKAVISSKKISENNRLISRNKLIDKL